MQNVRARARDPLRAHRRQEGAREPAPGNGHAGAKARPAAAARTRARPSADAELRGEGDATGRGRRAGDRDRACAARCVAVRRTRRCRRSMARRRASRPSGGSAVSSAATALMNSGCGAGGVERRADVVRRHADDARARQPGERAHGAGELAARVAEVAAETDIDPHRVHSASMSAGGGRPPDVSSRRFRPRPRERRFFFGPSSGFSIARRSS